MPPSARAFRVPEDIANLFEQGRKEQGFATGVEYFTALTLAGVARASGLSEPVWESIATDSRVAGAIVSAIRLIQNGRPSEAVPELRFAQHLISESLGERRDIAAAAIKERDRIKRRDIDGDDLEETEE